MKIALVYDINDHKLTPDAYSSTLGEMFRALLDVQDVQHITYHCNAKSIDADAILFYDVHSAHHIIIEGIAKHPAIKIEYFTDPHQLSFTGYYKDGTPVCKLGAKERALRASARGVKYIISPFRDGYNRFIAPHIDAELWWFPFAINEKLYEDGVRPLSLRTEAILSNGHLNAGRYKDYYKFRKWASEQSCVWNIEHTIKNPQTSKGKKYGSLLSQFVGSLAACNFYPIPKYFEIPLAGCVCLAQPHKEYEDLGFIHGDNCLYVNENNFERLCEKIKKYPQNYQELATAGRELVLNNYTAKHFADYIYKKMKEALNVTSNT